MAAVVRPVQGGSFAVGAGLAPTGASLPTFVPDRMGRRSRGNDGALDPHFGGDGIVRSDLTPGEDIGYDLAIQRDGKIVVAGSADSGGRFAVVRYRPDGRLDHTFEDGGVALVVRGGVARSVAIQPDGGSS